MASTPTALRRLKVVPHTHWDREWYRPFEAYRMRLVQAIDQVLDEAWPHFLLDGQTVVLDDYLAIRPERAEALRTAIAEGRLSVGPWFVLVDEFLVSGEALVRNLLEGRRGMAAFQASASVGYLPDMFGHIAQMPQLLQGFGLPSAVVWRGVAPSANRFAWEAPDGSRVQCAWLPVGYYQTALVTPKEAPARREALEAYLKHFEGQDEAWMLAGADHMLPDLAALLAATEEGLPGWAVEVSPLAEAIAGPEAELVIQGELRDPNKAYLLPGVLSTRPWIKRANWATQSRLERVAEPAAALAALAGGPDERVWLRQAWRNLMLNHPHDSICGCSVDQVHREMAPRFAAAEQIAEGLTARALGLPPAPPLPAPAFPLMALKAQFAPGPTWVEVALAWPLGRPNESPPPAPAALAFRSGDGQALRSVPLAAPVDGEDFAAELALEPDWHPVRRYRAAVEMPPSGVGLMAIEAHPVAQAELWAPLVAVGEDWIEHEGLRLEVQGGQVHLHDQARGLWHRNLIALLDEGDLGDSYNFSPELGAPVREGVLVSASVVEAWPHRATLALRYELKAPEGLLPDRSGWAAEVVSSYELRLTVTAGSPVVAGELRWDQARRDHRLRLGIAWGGQAQPRLWADGAYGLFAREPQAGGALPTPKGTEALMPEFPLLGLVVAGAGGAALGLATRGEHEAAWLDGPTPRLALTAMRAVGWLSRDDLATRGGGAGPRMPTPEAQCPGPQRMAFAVVLGAEDRLAELSQAAEGWRVPPALFSGQAAPGLLACQVGSTHPALAFDALKPAEDGDGVVLRAHNLSGHPLEGAFLRAQGPWLAEEVALDESHLAPAEAAALGGAWRPYQIRSWRLRPSA